MCPGVMILSPEVLESDFFFFNCQFNQAMLQVFPGMRSPLWKGLGLWFFFAEMGPSGKTEPASQPLAMSKGWATVSVLNRGLLILKA